ncbi:efflux RND transporter periplasmic adaptor subunit [Alteromonas gracilis]|uniref:efflux RND transporter periplasmic adaptor subunit n=1 Tax=Alteromonas gracilis TaxID=1479524 RepID=UPI0030CE5B09
MPIKSTFPSMVVGVFLGTFLSSILWYLLSGASMSHDETERESQKSSEPLYWVAPMDDSYRRDKPGKSPMGMDLVPVYAEVKDSSDMAHGGAGVVMISPQVQQNMGVKTEKVRVGALSPRIKVAGAVTYDEDEIMHIHPRVEGWIETLHIKSQGEEVKAGQPLYTLYSPELVNAQEEYLLALKRNDKRLIDGAEQRLNALALNERLIDDLKKNKRISQTVTFNAPQSGVVEALAIREGFFVQPGTTIMSIAKIKRVWVQAEVPSTYA